MSPHTIWLASYPKSGSTWVRALLTSLLRKDGELDINRLDHGLVAGARDQLERYGGLISSDLTEAEIATLRPLAERIFDAQLTEPRYRKIHDSLFSGLDGAPIVAPEAVLGAVYIVRDPRDVAISLAYHNGQTVEWATQRMSDKHSTTMQRDRDISPQFAQRLGSWSDHVRGWTEQRLFPMIVVRYEDLHADPARQLARIAQLGQLDVTPDEIGRAVEAATFLRMRERESRDGFSEGGGGGRRFFRRGTPQAWRDELPRELAERIVLDHREVMRQLGYS